MSKTSQIWQNLQNQEAELMSNRVNPNKPMPRYIIIKLLENKDKEKNLESSQRKMIPIGENQFEQQWVSHQKPWC